MSILDIVTEMRQNQKYYTEVSDAEKIFMQQKASIQAMRELPWYKEIKDFFKREADAGISRLSKTTNGELFKVQGRLELATEFLDFLNSLET